MKIEITILGLLMEGNLYGYEIKKKIDERLEDYVDIKFGSIYYAIKKAMENGWVDKVGSEKNSGNPERYIYEILPTGKKHYRKLVKNYFEGSFIHFDIDIVLMFLECLPDDFKNHFITEREKLINDKLISLKNKIAGDEVSDSPDCSLLPVHTYLQKHLTAEIEWLNWLKGYKTKGRQEHPE